MQVSVKLSNTSRFESNNRDKANLISDDDSDKPIDEQTTKAPETNLTIAIQPINGTAPTKRPYTENGKHRECPESVLPRSSQIGDGVFFGKRGGHVRLHEKFKVDSDLTISMEIKPKNVTGILTSFNHGKNSSLIVEMINGSIHFSVKSGDARQTVIFKPDVDKELHDGNWHTVIVIKSKFILTITVGKLKNNFFSVKHKLKLFFL